MLKKTLTFKDLDGNPITEDFYFNLNTSELAKLQLSHEGGFGDYLEKISAKRSGREVMDTFEDILRMSVGRRSEDNRKFIKTDEIRDDFMFSGAYDVLFMELITNAGSAQEFIKSVVPADLVAQVEAAQQAEAGKDESVKKLSKEELEKAFAEKLKVESKSE